MATPIAQDKVTGPLGTFDVSTIQTFAGGGEDSKPFGSPFADSDYASETPWPFETMIFAEGSSRGLYHAPYATKNEALKGHALMVETIKQGAEFGGGVQGDFGTPSITPEQWTSKLAARQDK